MALRSGNPSGPISGGGMWPIDIICTSCSMVGPLLGLAVVDGGGMFARKACIDPEGNFAGD